MKELNNKFYMEAEIELVEETAAIKKEAASVIKLPEASQKQPDLQYFSAVFVSSGTNLNLAHFMPSELVQAAGSVPSKAVDIEHEESEIIGHIYDYAFIDSEGNRLEETELASKEKASLDKDDIHIVIAGIIYKNRFPNIAAEVAENEWKVSMEAYYQDYDIKIGNMILDKREAELLGFDPEKSSSFGSLVKVVKKGVELASGKAARVLRNICFSGVGIVKNPANPPSVVLETAAEKRKASDTEEGAFLVLDYDTLLDKANNLTSSNIEDQDLADAPPATDADTYTEVPGQESSELINDDTTGICVNYKRRVIDSTFQDQDSTVQNEDWCSAYDQQCTSFSRDTSDPDCLRNAVQAIATACLEEYLDSKKYNDKRLELLDNLLTKVSKAKEVK